MISIENKIFIHEEDLEFNFVRSSGPGGQNVNKVSTAVQLRFNLSNFQNINEDVKIRIKKFAGRRITANGILIIEAKRYRTQEKNKQDAINRLIELFKKAIVAPKKRKSTKPTKVSSEKRIDLKKQRSSKKELRKKITSKYIE
jgi:ribosome-associated protein